MARDALSIALCTYDGARYLPEQLDSIAAQTRLPDELVVCDDGSTDGTVEIVRSFAKGAPFPVRLHVNERTLGSTKNFETAIGLCRSEVIALSDQDDVWRPEKLERILAAFAENPRAAAVFGDAEVVDEELRPLGYRLWRSVGFTHGEQESFRRGRGFAVLLRHNVVAGATLAFRAGHRDLVLPIPAAEVHDAWIALLLAAVAEVAILEEPLVLYRQHPASQIGGLRKSWLAERKRRRKGGDLVDRYLAGGDRFRHARDRLAAMTDGGGVPRDIMAQLEAKIRHLGARAAMARRRSRWRRLPLGLGELGTLRYHRYSNGGFRTFTKDLLRPTCRREAEAASLRRRQATR